MSSTERKHDVFAYIHSRQSTVHRKVDIETGMVAHAYNICIPNRAMETELNLHMRIHGHRL
jgi:hypothetical protein